MVRRILVALSGLGGLEPLSRCVGGLAGQHGANVTSIAVTSADAWKSGLPGVMTAGLAARLLESRPWEAAASSLEHVESHFAELCKHDGVRCEMRRPTGDAVSFLVSLAGFHDLVVSGVPPLMEPHTDRVLEIALHRSGNSGIPIIRPSEDFRRVRRVLLLVTSDASSVRALRAFVQLNPWPGADVCLAGGTKSLHLDEAAAFCEAHGFAVRMTDHLLKSRREAVDWAAEEKIDVVSADWGWFHAQEPTAPCLFLVG